MNKEENLEYIKKWIPEFNEEFEMKVLYDYLKAKELSDNDIYEYIIDNNEKVKELMNDIKELDVNISEYNKEEYEKFLENTAKKLKNDRSKTPEFKKLVKDIYNDNRDLMKRLT